MTSPWTQEDMAALTEIAMEQAKWCLACGVVTVDESTVVCEGCQEVIIDWLYQQEIEKLVQEVQEKIAIDKGLY